MGVICGSTETSHFKGHYSVVSPTVFGFLSGPRRDPMSLFGIYGTELVIRNICTLFQRVHRVFTHVYFFKNLQENFFSFYRDDSRSPGVLYGGCRDSLSVSENSPC